MNNLRVQMRDSKLLYLLVVFFFQAEDGIRDIGVTGVQTCALPISGLMTDANRPLQIAPRLAHVGAQEGQHVVHIRSESAGAGERWKVPERGRLSLPVVTDRQPGLHGWRQSDSAHRHPKRVKNSVSNQRLVVKAGSAGEHV